MKKYTMVQAAEILGMEKSSLHSVHQTGKIKTVKKLVRGRYTLYISEAELRRYAKKKAGRLQAQLDKMNQDFL